MSKVFYDKSIIDQIFEEFKKDGDKHDIEELLNLVNRLPPEDVNIQNNNGWTALTYAYMYGYNGIYKLLENYQKN